jgi:hypothetical protein
MSAAEPIDGAGRPAPVTPPPADLLPGDLPIGAAPTDPDAANDNRDPAAPCATLAFGPGIPVRGGAQPVRWPRVFP